MEDTLITSPVEAEAAKETPADAQARSTSAAVTNENADIRREEFERMIRGEYKTAFDERVKRIIDRRFKEMRTLKEQAARTQPIMDYLRSRYGETDESALIRKLTQAPEESRESETPRAVRALMREKGAKEILTRWQTQAQEAKKTHPDLDLTREAGDKRFQSLLRAGVDVLTAYEVVHARELTQSAMCYAAERTRERTISDIRARGLRPAENGTDGRGAARITPPRVKDMTRAQRDEIERRCARGEKVYFN